MAWKLDDERETNVSLPAEGFRPSASSPPAIASASTIETVSAGRPAASRASPSSLSFTLMVWSGYRCGRADASIGWTGEAASGRARGTY